MLQPGLPFENYRRVEKQSRNDQKLEEGTVNLRASFLAVRRPELVDLDRMRVAPELIGNSSETLTRIENN